MSMLTRILFLKYRIMIIELGGGGGGINIFVETEKNMILRIITLDFKI